SASIFTYSLFFLLSLFFFFICYVAHLDLHSFPTRRSSDLASGGIQGDVLATDNNTVGMGDAGIKSAIQGYSIVIGSKHITHAYKIGRAVQQECRDRSRMPSSA